MLILDKIVMGEGRALFTDPTHPYTRALLRGVPVLDSGTPRQHIKLHPHSFDHAAPLKDVSASNSAMV